MPRMLAGVPLSKCWEPFPRDSLSSPDLGLLGRSLVQVTAALYTPPPPPTPPIQSHQLPSPPPPLEHLGPKFCKARVLEDFSLPWGPLRLGVEEGNGQAPPELQAEPGLSLGPPIPSPVLRSPVTCSLWHLS